MTAAALTLRETAAIYVARRDQLVVRMGAHALRGADAIQRPEEHALEARVWAGRMSAPLRRSLLQFRRFGGRDGTLLLRGVPLGRVPSTPVDIDCDRRPPPVAAAAMSIVLAELGDPFGFLPELSGRVIQSIHPVPGFEAVQISVGSEAELEMHVETAFSDDRADHVAILCLRSDHDGRAGTTVASVDDMLTCLTRRDIGVLHEPRFRTKVDASFQLGSDHPGEQWVGPIRVLTGPPGRTELRVDFAETEGDDPEAEAALDSFARAARSMRRTLRMVPGDLLVLDNRRVVHGRTRFVPRYDGLDRWLLRMFLTRDIAKSAGVRPCDGRIIDPAWIERPTAG